MRTLLASCAVAATAMFFAAAEAHATVTWSFYETSCTPISGGGTCSPFTDALASLTLPGATSTGSADWTGSLLTPPVLTGDTDFTFTPSRGDPIAPPDYGFNSLCAMGGGETPETVCRYDINWSETAGVLTAIGITYQTVSVAEILNLGLTGAIIASDNSIGGCPQGGACTVTGFWRSDLPVSEPASAMLLLSGILGFGVVRPRLGRAPKLAACPST